MDPLVTPDWLAQRLGAPGLVVVDCRWKLGERGAGKREYEAERIPGAAFLDVDTDLSAPPGIGGRHPLPSADDFEAAARRAGIHNGDTVVAYDNGMGGAARLWWLLRHFGHGDARILDGGYAAWTGPTETGAPAYLPEQGDFTADPRTDDTATIEDIKSGNMQLIDARAPERYRGEVEPIDPVAGHIPGAINVPFASVAPQGNYAPPEEIRAKLRDAGDNPAAYCGSGITASIVIAAAEAAGVRGIRLYPGSWSEWSQTIGGSGRHD